MSNPTTAIDSYTNAVEALEKHKASNPAFVNEHSRLLMAQIDAENELRDAVAESKAPISNGTYRVTYTPQSQTFADIEEVKKYLDATSADEMTRQRLIKTQERPPRITIGKV